MPQIITNRGMSLLGIIVVGFILILALSYFNISIRTVVESPVAQDNINYVGDTGRSVWDRYLQAPASYLWNDVWVDIFWKGFINNMKRIRDGEPTEWNTSAPNGFDTKNNAFWGQ